MRAVAGAAPGRLPAMHPRLAPGVLAALTISWGSIPLIVRSVDLPSLQLVALRVALGAVTLLLILAIRRRGGFPRHHAGRLIVGGLLLPIHWYTFFQALETTRVVVALVVVYVAAPFMGLAATRLLGERLRPVTAAALVAGLLGAGLAVDASRGATAAGVGWGLIAALTMGAMILVLKPVALAAGGLVTAAWQETIAATVVAPWALAGATRVGSQWWMVVVLGVGLTGLSGVVYWWAVRHMPLSVARVLMYLEPVAAVVAAALVLDEAPGVRGWVGVLIVVASGAVAAWEDDRARRNSPGPATLVQVSAKSS